MAKFVLGRVNFMTPIRKEAPQGEQTIKQAKEIEKHLINSSSLYNFSRHNLNFQKMDKTANSLNWFEIPAADIKRAKKFYEDIFAMQMHDMGEMMGMKMVGFPTEMGNGKASGGLVQSNMHKPSMDGSVVYLNANPSIQTVVDRIEKSGGKVIVPKTQISPEIGYMAFFVDTEGNRVALHAQN
jgi:predicted enzyme related to lactoylglutathione lyase